MAHRTSAAALHAARTILKNFELTVIPPERLPSGRIPGITSGEAHVAVVIDKMSNAYELTGLRPELRYWQTRMHAGTATAPQIMSFFKKCLEKYALIPRDSSPVLVDMPALGEFQNQPLPEQFLAQRPRQPLSRAAFEAARGLFHYYEIKPRRRGVTDPELVRLQVIELIEVSLGIGRAEPGRTLLERCRVQLMRGQATEADVRACLRALGIVLEYLPNYEDREEETKLLV